MESLVYFHNMLVYIIVQTIMGGKDMQKRAKWMYTGLLSGLLLLSGCGVFQGEQALEEMDPPQQANYVDDLDKTTDQNTNDQVTNTDEQDMVSETVDRELYLMDQNGMIVPQTISLPKTKSVANQALEYLVKGGPITSLLPNGFQAVLPPDTEVLGVNLKEDGTIIVDLSKEFTNYRPEDELKVLQAMTYTLTEFDTVKRVQLRINGIDQETMPVNGTPVSQGLTRANGINLMDEDVTNFVDSKAVTVYYPAQNGEQFYYVPVTKHIQASDNDLYSSIVDQLIKGPSFSTKLLNAFGENVKLVKEPNYVAGVLTLTFNDAILNDLEKMTVSNEVMNSLVLSLTEQPGVDAVSLSVENVDQVFNENGEAFSEPVSRPKMVNTGSF